MDVATDSAELEFLIEKHEGDSKPITSQTNEYNRKLDDVKKQLIKRTNEQQKKVKVQRKFLETVEEVEQWHTATTKKLAVLRAVKEAPQDVKEQLEQVNVSYLPSIRWNIYCGQYTRF